MRGAPGRAQVREEEAARGAAEEELLKSAAREAAAHRAAAAVEPLRQQLQVAPSPLFRPPVVSEVATACPSLDFRVPSLSPPL